MDKEELYQQIQGFNNQLTNLSDRSSKNYEKAYLYVDDKNAIDKADFIGFLVKEGSMPKKYNTILDLTFGSGNLTSHIVFDNEIRYHTLILNDINTTNTNQSISEYIDNSQVWHKNILDLDSFEDKYADLVIINPQIGGNYIDGDISRQKEKEDESQQGILDKLSRTLNHFYNEGSTIVFYGKEKHFESIFATAKHIKYNSNLTDCFILKNDIKESLCFEQIDNSFIKCNNNATEEEIIESFDDIEIKLESFMGNDNKKVLLKDKEVNIMEEKKEPFSNKEKGNLNFEYKNILFKGVPGTGKSRAIDTIIEKELKIQGKKENILRVNIHSASSNADLMQGIGISTSSNGSIKYSEKQGLILDMIKRATFHPNQPFVLILEEIQENSLNELIGDLIYLIEDDKRAKEIEADDKEYSYEELVDKLIKDDSNISYIEIPYLVNDSTDYKKMIMPNNLFIFCTSNYRDDKKVIEDNLLRRFEVIEIYPKNQEEMGKDENGEDYFKSKDVSDFLESLNLSILKVMDDNHETHPDRFMIGHAIWQDVKDEKTFYKAFSKLVTEFKDIREVEFDIFKEILKDIDLPKDIEIELKKSYFELIKDIQVKINYDFIG